MGINPTEAQTRQELIDRQLARRWSAKDRTVIDESRLTVEGEARESRVGYRAGDEYVDYELTCADGSALAIVEAKRTSRDALAGKRQAADYADSIRRRDGFDPHIFLSNGVDTLF